MIGQQNFICGCEAQCNGLQKPVSLSTFNRHAKFRHAESFSAEFRGFLASSSCQTESNSETVEMTIGVAIICGNEIGGSGIDIETEDLLEQSIDSPDVRLDI